MKYDTIYRTVKASERLPEDKEKTHFVIYGSTDAKGTLHKDYFQQWGTKEWLEPLTNVHVFTEDELDAELIKFASWVIGEEGQMYRQMHLTAKQLLDTYRSRPYVKFTDP